MAVPEILKSTMERWRAFLWTLAFPACMHGAGACAHKESDETYAEPDLAQVSLHLDSLKWNCQSDMQQLVAHYHVKNHYGKKIRFMSFGPGLKSWLYESGREDIVNPGRLCLARDSICLPDMESMTMHGNIFYSLKIEPHGKYASSIAGSFTDLTPGRYMARLIYDSALWKCPR